jgi:Metallo-peptidase family M12
MFCSSLFGQGTYVFKLNKENLSRPAKSNQKIEEIFDSNHSYKVAKNNHFEKIKAEKFSNVQIETPDGTFKASLKKVSIPEYLLEYSDSGIDTVKLNNILVLNGDLIGNNKGQIRVVLYDNGQFDGGIITESKSYFFDYYIDEKSKNAWVNYHTSDEIKYKNEICGVNSSIKDFSNLIKPNVKTSNLKVAANCHIINIALDADYEFRQQHGTNSGPKMISSINLSEGHVGSYNLKFRIISLNVWLTSNDPYSSTTNVNNLTTEFRNYWNINRTNIPRDLAHLFTGRTPANDRIGNTDVIGAACTAPNSSYTMSVLRLSDAAFLAAKWTTHEIGHFLGCEHTDGDFCNNSDFATVMCVTTYANSIRWSVFEANKINTKLSSTNCFQVPNIRPTVNGALYTGPFSLSPFANATLSLNHPTYSTSSTTAYSWYVTLSFLAGNGSYTPNGTSANVSITNSYQLTGKVTDDCGYIASNNFVINKSSSFAGINVYPNSVNDYFDVELPEINDLEFSKIKIFNDAGTPVNILSSMEKIEPNIYRLQLTKHNNGIHFLHIINSGKIEKIRLNLN